MPLLRLPRVVFVFLLVLPIALYYLYFWRYSVNFPFQDDFDAIFLSLFNLLDAHTVGDYLRALTAQDDEHRIAVVRLITHAIYLISGQVDLRWVGFIGSLSLVGLLVLFGQSLRRLNMGVVELVPVAFLLFQIQPYEAIFWLMIAGQNFAVLFLAFLTLFWAVRGTRGAFTLACLAALMTVFTNSNGLLCFIPALLVLAYQRRWTEALIWVGVMAVGFWLYFHNLVIPAFRPKLGDNLRNYPGTALLNFFSFLGQFFDFNPSSAENPVPLARRLAVVIPAGVLVTGWAGYLILPLLWQQLLGKRLTRGLWALPQRLVNRSGLFWLAALLFILGTALIFAAGRAANGLEAPLMSRYRLNVALVMCLIYLTGLALFQGNRRTWYVAWLVGAIGTWGWFYYRHDADAMTLHQERHMDLFAWKHTRTLPSSPIYLTPGIHRGVDSLFIAAQQRGIYRFPVSFTDAAGALLQQPLEAFGNATDSITIAQNQVFLNVSGLASIRRETPDDGLYLVLKSPREAHLFVTHPVRNSVRRFLTTGNYYDTRYGSFPVLLASLQRGDYRIGLLRVEAGQLQLTYTTHRIRVEKSVRDSLTLIPGPLPPPLND